MLSNALSYLILHNLVKWVAQKYSPTSKRKLRDCVTWPKSHIWAVEETGSKYFDPRFYSGFSHYCLLSSIKFYTSMLSCRKTYSPKKFINNVCIFFYNRKEADLTKDLFVLDVTKP